MSSGESGTLISPNYPNNYPNNFDETYSIEVDERSRIELSFEDFDLESHNSCAYDFCAGIFLLEQISK